MKYEIKLLDTVFTIKPFDEGLRKLLTCNRVKFEFRNGQRVTVTQQEEMFMLPPGNTEGVCFIGSLDSVIKYCNKKGGWSITENCRSPLKKPNTSVLKGIEFRENQEDIIDTVCRNYNGCIQFATGGGKSFCISLLIGMFCPMEKMLVLAPKLSIVSELYNRIKERNPTLNIGRVDGKHAFNENYDCIVCSVQSLQNIEREWPTIIFYDECHTSASEKTCEILSQFTAYRRYGFSATIHRADGSLKIIESLLGPIRFKKEYRDAVSDGNVVPIKVSMITIDSPEIVGQQETAILRNGIWRHNPRNKKIAEICEQMKDKKILIMVTTVEHALYLKRFLPDYQIVHAGISEENFKKFKTRGLIPEGMTRDINKEQALEDFKASKFTKVISTTTWSTGISVEDLDCVIRADSQSSKVASLQISGRSSRLHKNKDFGLVVDFLDKHHPLLTGKAYSRLKLYQKEGWDILWDELPY